ncbi:hypothetical protein GCM10010317_082000 [Streptomyces mirabilis]|nr:hypothetical protein GCM10010317_082000 [Streptomyces mirabilis]
MPQQLPHPRDSFAASRRVLAHAAIVPSDAPRRVTLGFLPRTGDPADDPSLVTGAPKTAPWRDDVEARPSLISLA